jgi:hypothetical protein
MGGLPHYEPGHPLQHLGLVTEFLSKAQEHTKLWKQNASPNRGCYSRKCLE